MLIHPLSRLSFAIAAFAAFTSFTLHSPLAISKEAAKETSKESKAEATEVVLPKDMNILFWTVAQRDLAFRKMDMNGSVRVIKKGERVSPLASGKPLTIDFDLDKFFAEQRLAGMLVLHQGKIRYERYGLGLTSNDGWTSFSVAKSFTSTLVGAAIHDGKIQSVDDAIVKYIPELKGSAYEIVTVHQLLSMTSGVKWNENYVDPSSDVANFNKIAVSQGEDATVKYMQKLPRAHPPGQVWHYSTGETNLVGVLVSRATGKTLSQYLSEKIWVPLGMSDDAVWNTDQSNHEISGCCITARLSDYARFAQFILNDGVIDGKAALPKGWVAKATSKQTDFNRDKPFARGYGYQWWTNDNGTFAARGIFGQGIFFDPKRQLIVVLNGNQARASDSALGAQRERLFEAVQKAVDLDR